MNGKAFTIPNTRCLSELSRIMADKTPKKSVSLTDDDVQTRQNRQLEDLPLADFGRLPERLLLPVRTESINKNFVN